MKKYLIPLLISTVLTTTCFAKLPDDSIPIGKTNYLFGKTLMEDNVAKTVTVWIGYGDFYIPKKPPYLPKDAKSSKMRMDFYCSRQEAQVISMVFYPEKMFEGSVIKIDSTHGDRRSLVPGTFLYDLAEVLCAPLIHPKN